MAQIDPARHAAALFSLTGETAVVTGAGRGIGRTIALEFARLGAQVVVAARDAAQGEAVARQISEEGGTAIFLPVSVDDEASIVALMDGTRAAFGRIDILVNNAGIFPMTRFLETSAEQFDEMQRVNTRGTFLCMREAVRTMREAQTPGRIVNISSMGSVRPAAPSRFAYNASKAAVNRMTEDAAMAFARYGIRVNAILPGPIMSDPAQGEANPDRFAAIAKKIPLGRQGQPEEIAATAAFLASRASGFVTGQLLLADGGFTLG